MTKRRAWILIVAVCVASPLALAEGLNPREEFFENEVRPLLIEKCQECHDASVQESDLRLDSLRYVLQGGISGPAAIARNVDGSLIIKAVLGHDGMERMPPEQPLNNSEIVVLKKWVRMALPWPEGEGPQVASLGDQIAIGKIAETHWAFQPISHPTPPRLDVDFASKNPIDAFIQSRLSDVELSVSKPAPRRTILRRLYYDLIGLPPTAEQVESFERDPRSTEMLIEEIVTDLLASQHHGERWARYWLDLARYADTRDWQAQAELRYPYAYTYRDYVIESLNIDKPYDQFLREQIAADFYTDQDDAPELAALGLLTVGPQYRNNRLEQAADKIDVVCRGLMGITVSCARCHDHKYDPIPTEDYYSLYGVFASSTVPEVLPIISGHQTPEDLRADFEKKLAAQKAELDCYKQNLKHEAIKELRGKLSTYVQGYVLMSVARTKDIRGAINQLKVKETAMTPLNNNLNAALKSEQYADDAVMRPWHEGMSLSEPQFKRQREDLIKSWIDDKAINSIVRDRLKKDQPKSRTALAMSYARMFEATMKNWMAGAKKNPAPKALDNVAEEEVRQRLYGPEGWFDLDVEQVATASRLLGKGRRELGDREKAITEIEVTHPGAPPRAMAMVDLAKPITPFVLLRGEQARRGERVPRQFLGFLSDQKRKPFRDGSGRKELAEAIVDPANPLTARILVNRVWARYFGNGLVESLDDFGLRSSPPSHPELLDWLASEFVANGWSMKWLHRMIVNSNTYAQSSELSDAGVLADPQNRLLWRQNRRRLDFEAMRDSMLVVAESLDPAVGGRSVKLSEAPYSRRRSLYAHVDRNELDPMLRTFDFASPTSSAASRSETTIPQQALFSMNHPFVAELSREVSRKASQQEALKDQIDTVFRQVLRRSGSPKEILVAEPFVETTLQEPDIATTTWQYGYGPVQRDSEVPDFTPLGYWTGSVYQASCSFQIRS